MLKSAAAPAPSMPAPAPKLAPSPVADPADIGVVDVSVSGSPRASAAVLSSATLTARRCVGAVFERLSLSSVGTAIIALRFEIGAAAGVGAARGALRTLVA